MKDFKSFSHAVNAQFQSMSNRVLFKVDIDPNILWEWYLKSFPPGSNEIHRERTEHDCQCCKGYIKKLGAVVSINEDLTISSIWDVLLDDPVYNEVAYKMSTIVKSYPIKSLFYTPFMCIGIEHNYEYCGEGQEPKTWHHFSSTIDKKFRKANKDIPELLNNFDGDLQVYKRSLETISDEACEIVLELIEQNSLYRGAQYKEGVICFMRSKTMYNKLVDYQKDIFCWLEAGQKRATRIRNTAIGTLLVDLSEGKELNYAVKSFEDKVAPANYQRPKALVTKNMIETAEKKLTSLGILESLPRRCATVDDITVNNTLFVNREVKKHKGIFDELKDSVPTDKKKFDFVEEIDIRNFVSSVLPYATTVELYVEPEHTSNFVSLVAPVNKEAPCILKWDNNFSWVYNGEVADSIKERVKNAGGMVQGAMRCSLAWQNLDDLDIHIIEPDNTKISYMFKHSRKTGAKLDVDMNVHNPQRKAVENIVWPTKEKMLEGQYKVFVINYTKRDFTDPGFQVELEFEGNVYNFVYNQEVGMKQTIKVVDFTYHKSKGLELTQHVPMNPQNVSQYWNINLNNFIPVSIVTWSPNFWNDQKIGNEHIFFMLKDCKNPDKIRGFFNEYLDKKFQPERKVFELLGSKMKAESTNDQLSGLGFSLTQRASVLCKVVGSYTRIVKINF